MDKHLGVLFVAALLLGCLPPAALGDPLSDAFKKAQDLVKEKPSGGQRPERSERERTGGGSSTPSNPQPSQRQIQKAIEEAARKREQARIANNLKVLDAELAKAGRRSPAPPAQPVEKGRDSDAVINARRAELTTLARSAAPEYRVEVNPTTVRGASVDKMIVTARAKKIHDAILKGEQLAISVAPASDVPAFSDPWYGREQDEMVSRSAFWIGEAARKHGVDPDLIRAIIWLESTHGWYDRVLDEDERKTLLPMNVHVQYWSGLGFTPQDLKKTSNNVMAGTRILKELWQRVENPTVEKVATIYHNLGDEKVSSYGKTAAHYYQTKPWTRKKRQ